MFESLEMIIKKNDSILKPASADISSGGKNMLYSGLDAHKNYCQAVICTKDGEIIKEERIGKDDKDIKRFYSDLEDDVIVAFEASTHYEYYYDILEKYCKEVKLSHPKRTKAIAEERIKTDKIDANTLTHLLRANLLPTSYVPPKNIRELRHLVRRRILLGRDRARVKNKIHTELIRRGLAYDGSIFNNKGKNWLCSLNISALECYLPILETYDKQIKELDRLIKTEGLKYDEVKLLITIDGVGIYSGLIIFSEIGDITRFPSEEKLFSYSGLVSSTNQSGDKCYHGRITKEGSKYLRWILTEIVRVHLRWYPDSKLSRFYHRLQKKKPNSVAIIATARKLLQIIYYMLKNNKKYQG